jgi:CheY-like chemotaxis protein
MISAIETAVPEVQAENSPREYEGAILVVDDSPVDARLAAGIISKRLGLQAVYAHDGVEALTVLAREKPVLVLTDLLMPRMDGLELVDEICNRSPETPVILMTARGSEQIAMQALQAGAASYVPKSVLHEQLVAAVQRVMSVARVERRRQRFLEGIRYLECHLDLESDEALVPVFVGHVQEHLERMGLCDRNSRIRAGVALEEAVINGMHHGNLELSSTLKEGNKDEYLRAARQRREEAPYRERRLHVNVKLTPAEAAFVIRDEGPGFDLSKVPDPTDPENLLRPSGRGLLLIRLFMDEVSHNESGNQITMIRRRRAPR